MKTIKFLFSTISMRILYLELSQSGTIELEKIKLTQFAYNLIRLLKEWWRKFLSSWRKICTVRVSVYAQAHAHVRSQLKKSMNEDDDT